jgi:hypothetical protein
MVSMLRMTHGRMQCIYCTFDVNKRYSSIYNKKRTSWRRDCYDADISDCIETICKKDKNLKV